MAEETRNQTLLLRFMNNPQNKKIRKSVEELSVESIYDLWKNIDNKDAVRLFLLFPITKRVSLLELLSVSEQVQLISSLPFSNIRSLFNLLEPDDLVDIIQALPSEVRSSVWQLLSEEARQESLFLLQFDNDDAAGIMTPRYIAVRQNITVGKAIEFVRNHASRIKSIFCVYVLDQLKRLEGIVTLRRLLASNDDELISDIMKKDYIATREDTDQEEVARLLESYNLLALPVLDSHRCLLGVVDIEEALSVIRMEQTEDVYKMGAMEGSADGYLDLTVSRLVRKRVPWLVFLLLAGTLSTNLIKLFQPLIIVAGYLVWFLPVITQTGGNMSTQSSTLMIRGIARNEITFKHIGEILLKEIRVSVLIAFFLALFITLRSFFFPPQISLLQSSTIGISLFLVSIFSAILGVSAPLIIHRFGFDPTVMTGPLMSTLIDILGMAIYFLTAYFLLQFY